MDTFCSLDHTQERPVTGVGDPHFGIDTISDKDPVILGEEQSVGGTQVGPLVEKIAFKIEDLHSTVLAVGHQHPIP